MSVVYFASLRYTDDNVSKDSLQFIVKETAGFGCHAAIYLTGQHSSAPLPIP